MRHARRAAAMPASAPAVAAYAAMVLRRTGLRPLRFQGRVLLQAEDSAEPGWSRIRLAVYAIEHGDYVFEIFGVPGGGQAARPWSQATRVPNLAAGLACFEAVVPRAEPAATQAAENEPCAVLLACIAWWRRETVQVHALRHAIGDFLHRLQTQYENREDGAW